MTPVRTVRSKSLRWLAQVIALLILVSCSTNSGPRQSPTPAMSQTATIDLAPTRAIPTMTPTSIPSPTLTPSPVPTPTPLSATPIPTPVPSPTPTPEPRPVGQSVDLPNADAHYTLDITNLNLSQGVVNVDEQVQIESHQGFIPRLYFTVTTAQWGYFKLGAVHINDMPSQPKSLNDGFTLALEPPSGESWTIQFSYELHLSQVPNDWYGTGLDGNIIRLGYWFPMLSTNFPYQSTADPAYSRVATFDVSLPLLNDVPFVSTGMEVSTKKIDADHTRHFLHADNVRDFALVIAPGDQINTVQTSDGVTIRLLSDPVAGVQVRDTQLSAAKKAIETLSKLIGPYPYPVFSMADAGPSLPGGIEFPMMIDLNPNITPLDRLVYHETAHQWLYGIIGTRPQQDIWIDEGGAQFLEGYLDTGSALPSVPAGGFSYPLDSSDSELPQGAGIPGYQSIYLQGQRFYDRSCTLWDQTLSGWQCSSFISNTSSVSSLPGTCC